MRPLFVFVEGNIGSGKSTLLRAVEKFAWDAADNVAVVVVFEQVSSWVNVGGTDLLKAMYDDPARYSGLFQRTVLTSRAKAIEDALAPYAGTDKTVVVFCERSMWSGRNVFARMLHDTGKMDDTEYASYL